MDREIFTAALGIAEPWYIESLDFDAAKKLLTVQIDFRRGTRFTHPEVAGEHPVHDTQIKRYRHLNFFQHECYLEVRVPRIKLPDGSVTLLSPPWAGQLSGFTLLFEAMVLMLCREMPFAVVARLVGLSWHRVHGICERYVDQALESADFSDTEAVAIDETSRARGHDYITLVADAERRKVIFVGEGRGSEAIEQFADDFFIHGGDPDDITSASIDMSPAFISGVREHLPSAEITFDKFHVIAQASTALGNMRRIEQRTDPALKGLRWTLLKDQSSLSTRQQDELSALMADLPSKRTARAWLYREQLREILNRKQINVVRSLLHQWCTNVNRSKVEPMKEVARMIRNHMEDIWGQCKNWLVDMVFLH